MSSLRSLHLSKAKLKAASKTSALLAGFAMVAMVELQLDDKCEGNIPPESGSCSTLPDGLLTAFAMCTVLLVAVHLLALMISTCVLPHIEVVASAAPVDSITSLHTADATISEAPHITMHRYIEAAWIFSNVLGLLLFLLEVGILCWVKFLVLSRNAAIASTVLLVPTVLLFTVFALHFYWALVVDKVETVDKNLQEIAVGLEVLQQKTNEKKQIIKNGSISTIHVV